MNEKTCSATWKFGAGDTGITCIVCAKAIEEGHHAMDFFWEESKKRGGHKLVWAHNDCVRAAMQKWIKRKEEAS